MTHYYMQEITHMYLRDLRGIISVSYAAQTILNMDELFSASSTYTTAPISLSRAQVLNSSLLASCCYTIKPLNVRRS